MMSKTEKNEPDRRPATPAAVDPSARNVVRTVRGKAGAFELHLECGHVTRRRLKFCAPVRVICPECHAAALAGAQRPIPRDEAA